MMATIEAKRQRISALTNELSRSLLLQSIVPDCFKAGLPVTTSGLCKAMRGNYGKYTQLPYKFWVKVGDVKTALTYEQFKKLEGHKFSDTELYSISNNYVV